jgi:hypothetical protein
MSLGTAWINEVKMALLRLKDLEERIEALEGKVADGGVKVVSMYAECTPLPGQTGWGVLPEGGDVPDFDPVVVVKRKPGRPRKNA